ncbi:hypothetical protein GBF38_016776 [Nibea albiflora]|uniref:Uncharacterized protein n=1 Tax=Nibea albiflora TaxID=240163 RepID=A0ACB7EFN7_NIBAL|nr:hypothetical protein GBF38_016776 [Nibea albiflora]
MVGLAPVSAHSSVLFAVLCSVYVFVLCSDSLVVYLICSQSSLRPADVRLRGRGSVELSGRQHGGVPEAARRTCCGLAARWRFPPCVPGSGLRGFSLGASSFMLLAAMAVDRYLSICRPLAVRPRS